jgi:hypothetical protein
VVSKEKGYESDTHTTTGDTEKEIDTVKQVLNNNLTHTVFLVSTNERLEQILNTQKPIYLLSEKRNFNL